jgi:hexosaminidase
MNITKKILYSALIAALGTTNLTTAEELPLIPIPVKTEILPGKFTLTANTHLIADGFRDEARLLAEQLQISTGFPLAAGSAADHSGGEIVFTTKDTPASLGPEGYRLTVRTNGIIICANAAAGIFYGCQTLLQLLPPEIFSGKLVTRPDWTIPCVEISDSPRFVWRGFMLDVSRHFFSVDEVKHVLDLMALYKLNTFHWHLVDDQGWRIEIKKYPRLTEVGAWRADIGFGLDPKRSTRYDKQGRYGGYYTQHQIREIVAYATARHITVVPEIEMPGHSSAALVAYPEFACANALISLPDKGGVYTGVYCAGKESTFEFVSNVLAEVTPLFPGKYIHIGGDEVVKSNWMACVACQTRIRAEGLKNEHELQSYFIRRAENIVNSFGKNLIGWSEIREGGLAPNAVLMDWIGGGADSAASGHDVVMSPNALAYFDHYQSINHTAEPKAIGGFLPLTKIYNRLEPIPSQLPPQFHPHILGAQGNLWTEYVPNLQQVEYMMCPRLGALAEVTWSPKDSRDWESFLKRTAANEKRLDVLGVNYRPLSKPD